MYAGVVRLHAAIVTVSACSATEPSASSDLHLKKVWNGRNQVKVPEHVQLLWKGEWSQPQEGRHFSKRREGNFLNSNSVRATLFPKLRWSNARCIKAVAPQNRSCINISEPIQKCCFVWIKGLICINKLMYCKAKDYLHQLNPDFFMLAVWKYFLNTFDAELKAVCSH